MDDRPDPGTVMDIGRGNRAASEACLVTPDSYVKWRASDVGHVTEELELSLVSELLGKVRDKRILDVGCGDGALLARLVQQGAVAVGMDASPAMIQAAQQREYADGPDIGFVVGDARRMPFCDGTFDLVSAVTILCFVADPAVVFAEVHRVLKPGGRFVIGELGRLSTWALQRRVRAWLGSPLWRQGHFRTARELRHLATRAGMNPIQVRGAVYYPRSDLAARIMSRWDGLFGSRTTLGAAFVALSAAKPPGPTRLDQGGKPGPREQMAA